MQPETDTSWKQQQATPKKNKSGSASGCSLMLLVVTGAMLLMLAVHYTGLYEVFD